MRLLEAHEITRHPSYDQFGYVFTYDQCLYRAIYPPFEEDILRVFRSGLMDELIQNRLFPPSEVADFRTSDCNLVIRHEKVSVATFPFEWSFLMLKDAALTILKTNKIAQKYGYQIKDAHGFNVLFRYGEPLFVDLGSFVRIEEDFRHSNLGWWAYGEFMRYFYAPLVVWSRGDSFFARHALHGDQMPMRSFWRYQNPLWRLLPISFLDNLEFVYYKYKALNTRSIEALLQVASRDAMRERIAHGIIRFARRWPLPFSSVNLDKKFKQVKQLYRRHTSSKWGDYQSGMSISERHRYIIGWIKRLEVKTVLDLGGNAGLLARLILSETDVDHVICADYDENAIDSLYASLKEHPARIYPVLLDFGISITDTKLKPTQERFQSEAVLALALTHHLLLSQGMTIDFILQRLKDYSSKYVLVEFMPMGCYSSQKKKIPRIPEWYNVEWFRSMFEKYFDVLDESHVGENRILFIGQLRSS